MYLLLLSLLVKNFPRILIPSVLRECADFIAIIVLTHSYKTELPVFLAEDVLVAI